MFRKEITRGMYFPDPLNKPRTFWPYGVAWEDMNTNVVICYPIPFNLLFAWIRRIYWARKIRCAKPLDIPKIIENLDPSKLYLFNQEYL